VIGFKELNDMCWHKVLPSCLRQGIDSFETKKGYYSKFLYTLYTDVYLSNGDVSLFLDSDTAKEQIETKF